MTELETRTLARASILLLVAAGVRWGWEARRPVPLLPADSSGILPRLMAASDSAREDAELRARPLAEGERIDPNRASEAELDRLPGVGPALARALVASRESEGAFVRPSDLARVRGVGPATVAKLAPHLALARSASASAGGTPSPAGRDAGAGGAGHGEERLGRTGRGRAPPAALAGAGSGRAGATPGRAALTTAADPTSRLAPSLNLNTATARELERLPGVGPALAERIVALRASRGSFSSVDELLEVRGIGPATLERLRPLVRLR